MVGLELGLVRLHEAALPHRRSGLEKVDLPGSLIQPHSAQTQSDGAGADNHKLLLLAFELAGLLHNTPEYRVRKGVVVLSENPGSELEYDSLCRLDRFPHSSTNIRYLAGAAN